MQKSDRNEKKLHLHSFIGTNFADVIAGGQFQFQGHSGENAKLESRIVFHPPFHIHLYTVLL